MKNGKTVLRAGYSLNYDLPNFGTLAAPQTYFNMWSSTRSGFFTQVADGIFAVGEGVTPSAYTNPGGPLANNSLCQSFICMVPGLNIYGPSVTPSPPFNVVQMVRKFPVTHESRLQHHGRAAVDQQHSLQHWICRYKRSRPGKFPRPECMPRQHARLRLLSAAVRGPLSAIRSCPPTE